MLELRLTLARVASMKPLLVPQVFLVAVAALGAYGFVRTARDDHARLGCSAMCDLRPAYAGRNRRAPDFALPDQAGRPVRLSSYRGKPLVLNFWTQACEPCKKELPSLAELALLGADGGYSVLSVSADEGPEEVRDTLLALFGTEELPFPVLFDPELAVIRVAYGTTLYPETWLIDGSGIIRARFDGERNWSSPLARDVLSMLQRPWGCPVEFDRGVALAPLAGLCPAR